jgi:hypothetical protein
VVRLDTLEVGNWFRFDDSSDQFAPNELVKTDIHNILNGSTVCVEVMTGLTQWVQDERYVFPCSRGY